MNIVQNLITALGNLLMGADWHRLLHVVERVNDQSLTGAQRKGAAMQEIKLIGLKVGGALLNLLIELAVAELKLKTGADLTAPVPENIES